MTKGVRTQLFRGITLLIYMLLVAVAVIFANKTDNNDLQTDKVQVVKVVTSE